MSDRLADSQEDRHFVGRGHLPYVLRTSHVVHSLTKTTVECLAMVCYIILITVDIPVVKYIFVTIALCCSISIYPIIWPERIRAAHGTTAAGLAIGITNVCLAVKDTVHYLRVPLADIYAGMCTTPRDRWAASLSAEVWSRLQGQLFLLYRPASWRCCEHSSHVVSCSQARQSDSSRGCSA